MYGHGERNRTWELNGDFWLGYISWGNIKNLLVSCYYDFFLSYFTYSTADSEDAPSTELASIHISPSSRFADAIGNFTLVLTWHNLGVSPHFDPGDLYYEACGGVVLQGRVRDSPHPYLM